MKPESFEKLTHLKRIIGQMGIAEKVAFISDVSGKLQPDMLLTSDGKHRYSEENILCVALGALVADSKDEFEWITGFYGGGYQSELRRGLYHGKGEIPSKDWQREIRRLYHLIKQNSAGLKLPPLREFHHEVGSGAWKESKYDSPATVKMQATDSFLVCYNKKAFTSLRYKTNRPFMQGIHSRIASSTRPSTTYFMRD